MENLCLCTDAWVPDPFCSPFPRPYGCFLFKQNIINNRRLFLHRTLELTIGLRGKMQGRQQSRDGEWAALLPEPRLGIAGGFHPK